MMTRNPSTIRFFLAHSHSPSHETGVFDGVPFRPLASPGLGAGHRAVWDSLAMDEPLLLDRMVSATHGPDGYTGHDSELSFPIQSNVSPLDPYRYSLVPGLLRQLKRDLAGTVPSHRTCLGPIAEVTDRILAPNRERACPMRPGMLWDQWPDCEGSDLEMGQHRHIQYNTPLDHTSDPVVAAWETAT